MALLRPQLETIANRHRAVITAFHDRLDGLNDEQLRWSPGPKVWSPLLIVDHLIKAHGATNPAILHVLQDAPAVGDEIDKELPYSFKDRMFVKLLSPGAKFKLPVPKALVPVIHRAPPHTVLEKLYEELDAFTLLIEYANGKQLKKLSVSSPAGPSASMIAFLDATVQHDRYHWLQIEAILRDPKFPR